MSKVLVESNIDRYCVKATVKGKDAVEVIGVLMTITAGGVEVKGVDGRYEWRGW